MVKFLGLSVSREGKGVYLMHINLARITAENISQIEINLKVI